MGRGLGVAPPPYVEILRISLVIKKPAKWFKRYVFPIFFSKNKRGRIPYARILIVYKDVNAGR